TKGDRWKVRQGWRSPGWAIQPSSGEPNTGEPDALKGARPVREGAVGFPWKQGAGRLPHAQESVVTPGAKRRSCGRPREEGEGDTVHAHQRSAIEVPPRPGRSPRSGSRVGAGTGRFAATAERPRQPPFARVVRLVPWLRAIIDLHERRHPHPVR